VGQQMALLVRSSPEACRMRANAAYLEDLGLGLSPIRTAVFYLLRYDWFVVLGSPFFPARWVGRWEAPTT
jgi:hypothetical protein